MVTERARTLPTEPTEGLIAKSNPLVSFINIGQRGRKVLMECWAKAAYYILRKLN